MKLHIPKIKFESLSKFSLIEYSKLNTAPYGKDIAIKVADKLMQTETNYGLFHSHRDYCGLGLFYVKNQFLLMEIEDGNAPSYNQEIWEEKLVASFDTKEDFTNWLSNESDRSMAFYGRSFGSQTITKIRLLWFLEDNYSTGWNAYCNFLWQDSL